MNKLFLTIVFSLFFINGHTQDKWFYTVELDFIVPSKIEYNYSFNNVGTLINLDSEASLAIQYAITINFLIS